MSYTITRHTHIHNNQLLLDGKVIFENKELAPDAFLQTVYEHHKIAYPKFHKMDAQSKLGFLAAELLLKDLSLTERFDPYRIGVVLSNKSASLDTDLNYYNQLVQGTASPAIFVYTLPNIVIGEICIRQGIKGENIFFVSDKYEVPLQTNYINNLLKTNVLDACIGGWTEWMDDQYEAFLYLVIKEEPGVHSRHFPQDVQSLYNQEPNTH